MLKPKLTSFIKNKPQIIELLLLLIITIPAFISLLNPYYFSMHDDQHIVRLFLLDRGLQQGYVFPRWVDFLGFNFGYPLFNFYPPLIYYVAEIFHWLGFSLVWSIKLTFIAGFLLGAVGTYLFTKKLIGRTPAFLSAVLYTYFFYHAVLIYVRGALAEFFSMAILPFVFLTLYNIGEKPTLKRGALFGVSFSALILTHPLIAFPSLFYIGAFFIFYFFQKKARERLKFLGSLMFGSILGLGLSMFYWLPSLVERKFTKVSEILTRELASYKIHFVYPNQLWQSQWGYGGSYGGPFDGLTFQLGKIHIGLLILSVGSFFLYLLAKKTDKKDVSHFLFFTLLAGFSLFMTTGISSFIWDRITYLWFLQFPWRFLTFAGFFIAVVGSYWLFFLSKILKKNIYLFMPAAVAIVVFGIIFTYSKYFKPQNYVTKSDKELASFEEITWRISKTSFEFVPKGVATTKSDLNTTILNIGKEDIPQKPYHTFDQELEATVLKNNFQEKHFRVANRTETHKKIQINIFNFPGWIPYIDEEQSVIDDSNSLHLITLSIPPGNHEIKIVFKDTPVRKFANVFSLVSLAISVVLLGGKFKKI